MRAERSRVIRAAKFAGREVSYNGEKVYVDGMLAYDPDNPESSTSAEDVDHELRVKLWMYGEALRDLAKEDKRYLSNVNMWRRWNEGQRLRWINHVERNAQADSAAIGSVVVARAVTIRLTRQMT